MFQEILMLSSGPVKYNLDRGHIKMHNHSAPLSIKEIEFDYITQTIKYNQLKSGFEIATGLGISAVAAGLGFKETNGKLITIDSYIEEQYNDAGIYKGAKEIYENADGYKSVLYLIKHFGLEENVIPIVGRSPDDIDKVLTNNLDIPLDYVFIDGGHFEEQVFADTKSVLPFLNDEAIIFYHGHYSKRVEGLFTITDMYQLPDHELMYIIVTH